MRIEVLGPVLAYADDGAPIDLGGTRVRALLARLALAGNEVVSVDSLLDGLWGDHSSGGTLNALHALVHRLRKALAGAGVVETVAGGYRLRLRSEQVDAVRFEQQAKRGSRELAAGAAQPAASLLEEALALWRGEALADVRTIPFAGTAGARLDELRIGALEDRFEAELRLGHHGEILADVEAVAAAHPLRERLAGLRMRALHAAGRQSEALAVFEGVRRTLAEELGVDPSEALRTTHLAVLRGELDIPEAEQVRPEAVRGRLPAQLTRFVGREDELSLLAGSLETSRLVTVVGPGGVGKTRLAVEAVSRHRAHQRGRVWLVSLAAVNTADGLAEAVLGSLSVAEAQPSGTPLERVVNLLAGGEGVLVLDNCEQISALVAEFAGQLLERQPYLTILATSREPLEVMGETLCRLGPLDLPDAHADAVRARESAAVRLFLDRAAAVQRSFVLDASTAAPVVDIVRRLDGLPLALELAAARLRTMSAEQISRRLDDRFRLLCTGNRTAQPRQQTLHAVIEWSWDLLTSQERTLARRMSVFPARTGVAVIEAVCADSEEGLRADEVVDLLDSLVDKSIVEWAGDGYWMLETIRAHAADKLRLAAEDEAVLRGLTRYFADLAEEHEPLLRSDKQAESLRLFQAEYDNLMFALQTAIENGDASDSARILGPLYWYWVMHRYDARAEAYVAKVAEFGEALPADARAAFTALHLIIGSGGPLTDRLGALIDDCVRTGALRRYPMLLTIVLVMAPLLGLDELAEREIARVRRGSDRWAIACTFMIEAMWHRGRGDRESSTTAMATALHAFEEVGDRWWAAKALYGLAQNHAIAGDHDQAITAYQDSLAIAVDLGSQDEVSSRLGLATERMRAGDLTGAKRDIETAERAAWQRGQPALEIEALGILAELYRRSGEVQHADQELDRMETLIHKLPLAAEHAGNRLLLARVANLLTAGNAVRARELLPRAVHAAQADRDAPLAAQLLARLLFLEGDPAGAATALGLSEAVRGTFDHGDTELRWLAAALAERLGRTDYETAYHRGADLTPHQATDRLTTMAGAAP
ncbi:transcriptional regulator, winged helix family [Kribbella flavida DSM 17836]|uniref:Transcriptional regulator, winged helix family n=1 Tax=Kribbella flavida (strain DSM 17836 / JCM 10339 / NBRC 14399) TaxID=479435 RepID=D2PLR1_KRIFD|nr:BTAD domain-containing putative transcriptional regulator [Kribbella flavida]ADB32491.1 transcriptional regulator, winged helix family [Kribbella flavida DSM 17836]